MTRAEYEVLLKSKNIHASAACDKHLPDIIEMHREELGVRCHKCNLFFPYEKLAESVR